MTNAEAYLTPRRVDHLVYAVPDLAEGVALVEDLLGVRPASGGVHPGWGTANALLALGPRCYLEVIGPDPRQPDFEGERIFRIDRLSGPTLVTWAAAGCHLERLSGLDLGGGERIGDALPASRKLGDGSTLQWVLTDPSKLIADGLVPFFIDWGTSPHPSQSAPGGARLTRLEMQHPRPQAVRAMMQALDIDIPVSACAEPAIAATIRSPRGEVTLR